MSWYMTKLLVFLLHCQSVMLTNNKMVKSREVTIPIAVMLPFSNEDHNCTHRAIELAINDVNSRKDFIVYQQPGAVPENDTLFRDVYKFKPYYTYTSNSVGDAIEALHSSFEQANIFATVGPPYKEQVEFCTEYTTANANTLISYSEANEPISDYFVMYHQTPPSISSAFEGAASLLRTYNWSRVGMIYDYSDKRYRKNGDNIRAIIKAQKIKIEEDQGIWSIPAEYSVTKEIGALQVKGIRIIMALVGVRGARKVFCEAYHRKMYRPKVIWIIFETLPEDWASDKYNSLDTTNGLKREVNCTEDELHQAADGYISIVKKGIRQDMKKTISGMNASEFKKRLEKAVGSHDKCNDNIAYAYDTVWVLAMGSQLMARHSNLTQHNYLSFDISILLARSIKAVNFEGLTGSLSYKADFTKSVRRGLMAAWVNHNKEEPKHFADYDTFSGQLDMMPDANNLVFGSGGSVPKDRAIYKITSQEFDRAILIIMWLFSLVGILIALAFLAVIIYLLRTRLNCLDTPIIDIVMIIGCILCYLSVIVYGLDTRYISKENTPDICTTFLWILSIGFTLTFGALFSKTWRMYKQYMTPGVKVVDATSKQKEKCVPEWVLIIVIGIFVLGDAVILSVWTKSAPFYNDIYNVTTKVSHFADVIEIKQVIRCACEKQTHFTIGIYCYKGLLLIFGIFLAWQTRHAKFRVKNNSKEIAMAIYNIVAVSIIGVICVTVLSSTTKHQALFSIVAVCIVICTTTTLILVFLNKLRRVFLTKERDIPTGTLNAGSETPNGKYTLEYMRKPVSINTEKAKRQISNNSMTLTTQISLDDSPRTLHMTTSATGMTLQTTNNAGSVVSVDPSFLQQQSSPTAAPPTYLEVTGGRENKSLNSGIYVGGSTSSGDEGEEMEESAGGRTSSSLSSNNETIETVVEFDATIR